MKKKNLSERIVMGLTGCGDLDANQMCEINKTLSAFGLVYYYLLLCSSSYVQYSVLLKN